MIRRIFRRFEKTIRACESIPLTYCTVSLFAWIFIRIFIEGQFEYYHAIGLIPFSYRSIIMYFIHFPMFYLSLYLAINIIISAIGKMPIKSVLRVTGCGMVMIVFIPILDAIIGNGFLITYPLRLETYFVSLLNPFVSLSNIGISPGQRIVILLISIMVGLYVYTKSVNVFRSVMTAISVLICIVVFGGLTTIIAGNRPELSYVSCGILYTDSQKFAIVYTLLFIVTMFISEYMYDPRSFRFFIRSMRVERMVFYGGAGLFGMALAGHIKMSLHVSCVFDIFGIISLFLGLGLAFWALQVLNDFFDRDGDAVSRSRNPLLQGIDDRSYAISGLCLAIIALIISAILNYTAFLIMITYLLAGIVYSMPPARLKRFPCLSTFVLAFAVILCMAMGFSIFYQAKALSCIPGSVVVPTLIGITVGFSAKDINDIIGDRSSGVITIPMLLMTKNELLNRVLMGVLLGFSFIVYVFFTPELLPGAMVAAIVVFVYTLLAKPIREFVYFFLLYVFGMYYLFQLVR